MTKDGRKSFFGSRRIKDYGDYLSPEMVHLVKATDDVDWVYGPQLEDLKDTPNLCKSRRYTKNSKFCFIEQLILIFTIPFHFCFQPLNIMIFLKLVLQPLVLLLTIDL